MFAEYIFALCPRISWLTDIDNPAIDMVICAYYSRLRLCWLVYATSTAWVMCTHKSLTVIMASRNL